MGTSKTSRTKESHGDTSDCLYTTSTIWYLRFFNFHQFKGCLRASTLHIQMPAMKSFEGPSKQVFECLGISCDHINPMMVYLGILNPTSL